MSKIEWTDRTWNPATGCTKVSAGCKNCYAEKTAKRLRAMGSKGYQCDCAPDPSGPRGECYGCSPFDVRLHHDRIAEPLRWRKPAMVFVCSMGDLFHEDVPFKFIAAIFGVMAACPQHTFQVLTKRPERAAAWFKWAEHADICGHVCYMFDAIGFERGCGAAFDPPDWPLPNVWLGTTAENQEQADKRIPLLLQCPAAVRFVSVEPMLGPVDLSKWLPHVGRCELCWSQAGTRMHEGFDSKTDAYYQVMKEAEQSGALCTRRIDWVICGGESGPGARPMHPSWPRGLRDQCAAAGVAFSFKQHGEWIPSDLPVPGARVCAVDRSGRVAHPSKDNTIHKGDFPYGADHADGWTFMYRVGKKAAGSLLDGVEHKEWPS